MGQAEMGRKKERAGNPALEWDCPGRTIVHESRIARRHSDDRNCCVFDHRLRDIPGPYREDRIFGHLWGVKINSE
jgi:hypothetical protein